MADVNKEIAPAWDYISIPAEDEAGQDECSELNDCTIPKPMARSGL